MKFKKQKAFCMICGTEFLSEYGKGKEGSYGSTCSPVCLKEWEWRKLLYILGHDYSIDPQRNKNEIQIN